MIHKKIDMHPDQLVSGSQYCIGFLEPNQVAQIQYGMFDRLARKRVKGKARLCIVLKTKIGLRIINWYRITSIEEVSIDECEGK
jgi:hypothetical protein